MTEHYTRNTVSAEFWCGKCQKRTQHRIDDRRKGPCLECIAKLDAAHEARIAKAEYERQRELFG